MANQMRHQHRVFLQGLMCQKMITYNEVKDLFEKGYRQANVDIPSVRDEIAGFINVINHNIKPFHMKIQKGITEMTGKACYALANEEENPITRTSTIYNSLEIELYRKLVELIVLSGIGNVSSSDVLHLTDDLKKPMSKSDAQKLMKRFEEDKLIIQTRGRVSLSTLAILELDKYFHDMYPESIVKCGLCKQLVFEGSICDHCDIKIHHHCAERLTNHFGKCPQCKSEWRNNSGQAANTRNPSRKRKSDDYDDS